MTPDPELLFLPPGHREALAGLLYAILNRKGLTVLIGDAGTGKTTLLTKMLQTLPSGRIQASVIFTPTLTPSEFLEATLMQFGVNEIPQSKAQRIAVLVRLLEENYRSHRTSVLIVDEAQALSREVLEEIRLLSNFGQADQNFLQIVLSGQDELGSLLSRNDLRQLKQRIAVRLTIGPLAEWELEPYIRHRWIRCGGGATLPFSRDALNAIASASHGIPRLVNALCDNALTTAFGRGTGLVDKGVVLEAVRDLALKAAPSEQRASVGELPQTVTPQRASTLASLRAADPPGNKESGSTLSRWSRKLGLVD